MLIFFLLNAGSCTSWSCTFKTKIPLARTRVKVQSQTFISHVIFLATFHFVRFVAVRSFRLFISFFDDLCKLLISRDFYAINSIHCWLPARLKMSLNLRPYRWEFSTIAKVVNYNAVSRNTWSQNDFRLCKLSMSYVTNQINMERKTLRTLCVCIEILCPWLVYGGIWKRSLKLDVN